MTRAIYEPLSLDNYELCHPVKEDDFEAINLLINGTARHSTWKPIPMEIVREDEGQRLLESDSPWLGSHALIFRRRAADMLASLLQEHGELLPLQCNEADVVMYNPTRLIDALDEEASAVLRFQSGRIMRVNRYELRPQVVGDIDIFKLPSLRVSPTFVSERFVDLWNSSDLRGLEFKRIWVPRNWGQS
jgi:hypothetical protein